MFKLKPKLKTQLVQITLGAVGSIVAALVSHFANVPITFGAESLAAGAAAPALSNILAHLRVT